jgi:hypothetical protein
MSLFLLMKRCGIWRGVVCAVFEVLTAVPLRGCIFWDITPCSPLKVASKNFACYMLHADFLLCLFFDPEVGGNMFFCWLIFSGLHGIEISEDRPLQGWSKLVKREE